MPEEYTLTGDERARGYEWNLAECEGIFLLIGWYLTGDVHPVAIGVHGTTPVVFITIDGFGDRWFKIYEFTHFRPNGRKEVEYASTFDFSVVIDCRPNTLGDLFYLQM